MKKKYKQRPRKRPRCFKTKIKRGKGLFGTTKNFPNMIADFITNLVI